MKKYKSKALGVLHEMMNDIHKAGGISDERMRFYDEGCLVKSTPETERAPSQKTAGSMRSGVPAYARGKY